MNWWITPHSAATERKLRRYAEIAGGETALQHGFETWYESHGRTPTAEEFTKHLIDLRIDQVRENTRRRVEARLRQLRQRSHPDGASTSVSSQHEDEPCQNGNRTAPSPGPQDVRILLEELVADNDAMRSQLADLQHRVEKSARQIEAVRQLVATRL